jgi:hypothetical protein
MKKHTNTRVSDYLLSAFAKVLKVTSSYLPSVWKNSAPTGRIFMKFHICIFFRTSVEKIQVSLISDKNNGYFT